MALDNLRILKFEAENVKRLKVVEISPKGDVIEVLGKNGNGKTSVLDSIEWAIAGKSKIQWKPIREGEESATIRLELGNDEGLQLKVTRKFFAQEDGSYTTTLHLQTADGMKPRGEQTLLNTIMGAIAFDPGAFMLAKPDEQAKMLKAVIPDVDFEGLEQKRRRLFEERTQINREEKRHRASAESITVDEGTPDEPVSTDDVLAKIRDAGKTATLYHDAVTARERVEREARRLKDQIIVFNDEIERLEEEIKEKKMLLEHVKKEELEYTKKAENFQMPPTPEDTAQLSEELNRLQEINKRVAVKNEQRTFIEAAKELAEESDGLTAEIEEIDKEIRLAIERANLPVRGLEIRDDAVYLRGVPFNQASDAEQLRCSMALGIASNPRLRVLRIRNGSLLDDDAMEIIREVAADEQFQIWIERVGTSGGPEAVILENGMIKDA